MASILGVQIKKFENSDNIEIRGGEYCCCDVHSCLTNNNANSITCNEECEPYYVVGVNFQGCPFGTVCSVSTSTDGSVEYTSVTNSFLPRLLVHL